MHFGTNISLQWDSWSLFWTLSALTLAGLLRKTFKVYENRKTFSFLPGPSHAFRNTTMWMILPKWFSAYFVRTISHAWKTRRLIYQQAGWDVVAHTTIFPPATKLLIADAGVAKLVCFSRDDFGKPLEEYQLLQLFGNNVVTTEGEEWLVHRKLLAPVFAGETNRNFVWDETVRLVNEMLDDWGDGDYRVSNVTTVTREIALMVICGVTVGRQLHWKDDEPPPPDHQMSLLTAVKKCLTYLGVRIITPEFIWGDKKTRAAMKVGGLVGNGWLGKGMQNIAITLAEVQLYMEDTVDIQRSSGSGSRRRDVLYQLVEANDEAEAGNKIPQKDVFGNIFILLLAGHETTAHSLAFLLGLLALEDDKQEELVHRIKSTIGNDLPTYQDLEKLSFVLAYFYEALRLFPAVHEIPKMALRDTVITAEPAMDSDVKHEKGKKDIFVPKGTHIQIHAAGIQYNPKYWKDPYEFRPERFLEDDWPRDAFVSFSLGPRACVGRRLSEIEATAFLCLILPRYKVQLDTSLFPDVPGETKLQRRERLLDMKTIITPQPKQVPLVFVRR